MRGWLQRARSLHGELAAVAPIRDPRWWLLAGGVALAEPFAPAEVYLACDCTPDADTLMAFRAAPFDPISAARAAQTALRELDGTLPDQPLAITVERSRSLPSALDVAAFAVADRCLVARLDDPALPAQLARVVAGAAPPRWHGPAPFVCISLGEEPIETARHGHRRAWTDRGGPWLGIGRAAGMTIVSTCHLVVDGFGHAAITARIAELATCGDPQLPAPRPVADAVPLTIRWRELPKPAPRALALGYALGQLLHREAGDRAARMSPTFQLPVARGAKDDPLRLRRRVVAVTTSVRFDGGRPEPFEVYAARTRDLLAREALGQGPSSRLLAAARAVPVPVAFKRRSISAQRPPWMEALAELLGGRALLSKIVLPAAMPATCAVSSPTRMATSTDPRGSSVITLVESRDHAVVTACASGFDPAALIDELLDSSALPVRVAQ